jgi:DNA polymerase-3 subunit alpha
LDFCHLHLHSEHSLLDGYGKADQYVSRAVELGQDYLGCTDHGNIDGLIKFQASCKARGVTPVLGVELYIVPDLGKKGQSEKRYHIVALMTNDAGLANIMAMLSVANLDGFYRRPRIDPKTLLKHRGGLIFMSACISSFVNMRGGIDLLLELSGTNTVCLEVMPHDHQLQRETNAKKLALSKKYDIPLVATCDAHYPLIHQSKTQEVLLAIQHKKKWTDADRFTMKDWQLHLRSAEEMVEEFENQGVLPVKEYLQAIKNTVSVAQLCNGYTISKQSVSLPKVCGYEDRDETELLWSLVKKGFFDRFDSNIIKPGQYQDRLNEEMDIICRLNFQRYFLIVWELVDWCHKNGIMTGPGRGSVGGSLVAYLLHITDVDPIKHGLIFARFISPERNDFPDIDMDFEDERRAEVRQHLEDCYGHYNVAGISTFLTMKGRGALRDVSRVFGVNPKEVDRAAKTIASKPDSDPRSGHAIEDAYAESEEMRAFHAKYPEVTRLAVELEGQVRGAGQHAAAVCISAEDLRLGKRCNFCVRDRRLVANWEKDDAEYMGMMKLDILGLSSLTLLNYAKRLIRNNHDVEIEFDKLPIDDKLVFAEINAGHSVGIFQIGSPGLIKTCKEMGISEFTDIAVATSLFRPGPLGAGMVDEYIARKKGQKPVIHIHPKLEPYTRETLGIVVYQEQVMWVMYELAGLSWGVCDKVRKIMGKSRGEAEFQQFKQQFVQGCLSQGTLSVQEADRVWDMLASFSSYGFNKAHAIEYSMISYWMMYCKVHFAKEFMAALLTHGGDDQKSAYINEARRLGLQIQLPRLGISSASKWIATKDENILYAPFTEIKGIGEAQASKIASGEIKTKIKASRINRGFFDISPEPELVTQNHGSSMSNLLHKVGADGRQLSPEEAREAQQYFGFNIMDKANRFKKLYELEARVWADLPEESLLKCEISNVNLLRIARYVKKVECDACQLRQECTTPVSPSVGRYNVMIAGEGPGDKENELGLGFIGPAGEKVLWPELARYGLSALMFHVTNVVKCWPSKTKTPGKKHIDTCRPILEDEISNLQPIVILALGNTSVKFFADKDSGIINLSGQTEWSDKYKCWICWCVHPAAVLRSPSNRGDFENGIRNFAEVLGRIGGANYPDWPDSGFQCKYGAAIPDNNNFTECEICEDWGNCALNASREDWSWYK